MATDLPKDRGAPQTFAPAGDGRGDAVLTSHGQADDSARERREVVSLMTARVGDAYLRTPVYVDGGMDLVSVCRFLSEQGRTGCLVRDGDRLGVFTTTDLRDALLRPEPPSALAVREMTVFAPLSVSVDDELYAALILMLRHRIHRVIVRDGTGAVVGVLTQLDLMAFVTNHSHLIAREIETAGDVASLKAAAGQIEGLIRVLRRDGVRIAVIAGLVGALNRQVFARLWALLAPDELRANSCLVVMGSEGRGEQIIRTDQDNALILRDGFAFDGLAAVTEAFTAALIDFGYPPCPGGIMLSRPLWCQPLAGFREAIRDWVHGADPEGAMNLAIFIDAAVVDGDAGLLAQARDHVDRMLVDNAPWFGRFARAVEQFGDAGGWWSRLPGLRGRAAAEIDLKKLGLFPVVHGVRALALENRVRALGTVERLQALEAAGRIDRAQARDLADALHFLMGLKLDNNLRQIEAGRAPGNSLLLADLGTLDRQALKDSIAIVRGFKEWLGRHYRFDAL